MRLLLDTHIFLWFVFGDSLLNPKLRLLIEDKSNEKFWSMASVWEMAIKVSTGKLELHQPVESFIAQQLQREDFHLLPIALNHAARVSTMLFHHRDPFDRLIIAQG